MFSDPEFFSLYSQQRIFNYLTNSYLLGGLKFVWRVRCDISRPKRKVAATQDFNHKDTKETKIRKNLCALCVFVVLSYFIAFYSSFSGLNLAKAQISAK